MCYLWKQNSMHGFNLLSILNAQHDVDGNTESSEQV